MRGSTGPQFLSTCAAEENSEEAEEEDTSASSHPEPAFQIVGSVSASNQEETHSFLHEQYAAPTREELLEHLLECDVVIYNISECATEQQVKEATWAIEALHAEMENFKSLKIFILLSTVMSWAMTKPQNPEETDVVLTEEEFRRRRPHPSFRNHHSLEKLVLKLGKVKKTKLTGYVVACGLQYGKGENLFSYFFKVSWLMQLPKVPLFGEGTNYIPTIHVYDLGGVLQNIIEHRPKSKYIVAVDDSKNTLEDIVKMISDTLGPGELDKVPAEEAIAMKAFKPEELEYLCINLRLDAFIIRDSFSLNWVSETGMVANMESIVEEYKDTRQLIKEMVNDADPAYVSEEVAAAARKQLDNLNKNMEMNAGRLADHLLFEILKEKLNSKPCRNQGFVLDGFLKTYAQAKLIFSEHVFALNATDDFLTKRVQGLPQIVAEKMRYTQEEFVPRLTRYRQLSTAEETLLDYFDELEIHPEHIEVTTCDPEYKDVMKKITEMVGIPKNYGLSPEEQEEEDRRKEEERKQKAAAEAAEKKRRNEAALTEMAAQYEDWQKNLSELKRQEHELLEAHALPLRNYLMKYVMPSLSEAMLDCCKIKPEDPVDFLAEYLLRNNQEEQQPV
ncbi:Adenylate kinase 7 [Collichthys lucidus]|uniref:Adenylate kinase 7 n=1 Tax=Collichthys lucidus TaxID=240159 RepID=A0A4U5UMZ9_COLLU|nr:Adenylate kinase 7 [Collichthys lucidus]